MKLRLFALSLSLLLVACQSGLAPVAVKPLPGANPSSALSSQNSSRSRVAPVLGGVLEIQNQGAQKAKIAMRLQVPRLLFQSFRTQAATLDGGPVYQPSGFETFAYLRVSLQAPPMAELIYPQNALRDPEHPEQDYLIENTGEPLTVLFENVPAGTLRFATISAFNSDKQPIPGTTIQAVFAVGPGSEAVSQEVTFRTTPAAQVMNLLLLSDPDLAKSVDLVALQNFLDQLTGLEGTRPQYVYTRQHPLGLNAALLAADLRAAGGNPALLDTQKNYTLPLAHLTGTVQGLATGDHLKIQTSDFSHPLLEVTANGSFNLEGLRPGSWHLEFWVEGGAEYAAIDARQVVATGAEDLALGQIVLVPVQPVVEELSKSQLAGGETLRIYGQNFHATLAGNKVLIGEQEAEILNASSTELEIKLPWGAIGEQELRVEVGSSVSEPISLYRYGVSSISASRGRIGDLLTLRGTDFNAVYRVIFPGESEVGIQANYEVLSDSELQVRIPGGAKTGLIELRVGEGERLIAPGPLTVDNRVIFVDAGAESNGTGLSWDSAVSDLQQALNTAQGGDEVWVRGGVYFPDAPGGDRSRAFVLKDNLALYGGFTGLEKDQMERNFSENTTVLSGDLNEDDAFYSDGPPIFLGVTYRQDNSYHVVKAVGVSQGTVLDGFTVRGGQADIDNISNLNSRGAGILCDNASPTLRNLVIQENYAYRSGAGMEISHSGSPLLENIVFFYNRSENANNVAAYGGGLNIETYSASVPQLKNIVFANNFGMAGGGGLSIGGAQPILTQATFFGNSTNYSTSGSAISMSGSTSSIDVRNSVFWGNAGYDIYAFMGTLRLAYNALEDGIGNVLTSSSTGGALQDQGGNLTLSNTPFLSSILPMGPDGVWMTPDDGLAPPIEGEIADAGSSVYATIYDILQRQRPTGPGFSMGAYEELEFSHSGCYPYGC